MEFLVTLLMRFRLLISNISLLLLPAVLLSPGLLRAAPEDVVQAYVSASVMHDDNLLRLSSAQAAVADTIQQDTLGLKVNWRQGRQQVLLDASINQTRYSNLTSLGYQATNLQSRWNWQLGNSLSGDMGYSRSTSQSSFAELHQAVNNLNTRQEKFADGAWQIQPSWRLNGGMTQSTYSVASNSVLGNESTGYTVGATFTPLSGNEIGIRSNRLVQSYPVLQVVSNVPVDNGFTQDQLLATVNWNYSGHIRLYGQAGVVSRAHNQVTVRDFSGKTMHGTLSWLGSGKTQIDLSAWDELDAYDDLVTNSAQSKGVSVNAVWSPTGKLNMSVRGQQLKRDFILNPNTQAPLRQDTVNSSSFSVNYQPVRAVNLSASMQAERRSSTLDNIDYADNTINLGLYFVF